MIAIKQVVPAGKIIRITDKYIVCQCGEETVLFNKDWYRVSKYE